MNVAARSLKLMASLLKHRGYVWLPHYLRQRWRRSRDVCRNEKHLVFLFVDHFEPSRSLGAEGVLRVKEWCDKNREVCSEVRDDNGRPPQHTWFYRYDYPSFECLTTLSRSVYDGLGEIEFHLHHGYDTSESFRKTLQDGKRWFSTAGAMTAVGTGDVRFGYIAGNWALADGQGNPAMSGVKEEIAILAEEGCYADFTFPAFGEKSQPRQVNSLYYAKQSSKPRCYSTGAELRVGHTPDGDLMIFNGPIYIDAAKGVIDYAAFENYAPYLPGRAANWIKAGISVTGSSGWTFVKIHTHGMQSAGTVVGRNAAEMYIDVIDAAHHLGYGVHFVSAREAYNIAKAAEAGRTGDPAQYRNWLVPPPVNTRVYCSVPATTALEEGSLTLNVESPGEEPVLVLLKDSPVAKVSGTGLSGLVLKWDGARLVSLRMTGSGNAEVHLRAPVGADEATARRFTLPCTLGD